MKPSPFDSLLQELARKDFLTYQHGVAVAEHMGRFAEHMKMGEAESREAEILGAIHDLGKLRVAAALFKKLQAGMLLANDERTALRTTPAQLLEVLAGQPLPDRLRKAIEQMRCRFDGKGEPPLKGKNIHPYARMLAIADCYDMLTRQRTGRLPLSEAQSRQVLMRNAGVLFDPELVRAFLAMMEGTAAPPRG